MSNTQRFQAIKQIMIDSKAKYANMKPLTPDMIDTIEKFVRNHNLKIQLSDVIGYYDLALFGSGKKGMLLTANFLYYSENGKKANPVYFKDLVFVSKKDYNLTMIYANGKNMKFFASIFVDYLLELMMKIIELDSVVSKSSNEADQKIDTVTSSIQSVLNQKMKEEEEQKKREEQARLEAEKRQKEAEEQARLEAEKKLKDLEEQKRKEAEEKAKAEQKEREEQARLEMEKRQKEAERKARAEAETLARVEEEKEKNAQVQDGFSHLDLCRQYCAEMRSIPGVPIGCERMLHIDEIRNIAKNCKCAKELNLKFGEEVDRKELETFLRDKKLVQRELVLAFADHGKQGAVLIATSYDEEKLREVNSWLSAADRRNNNHNIIYCSAEGEVKMFTLDEAGVSIHGAYMEQDQLVVWDYLFKPISFQPGTLGPALAELLQKLAIAFRGEKDYKQIQELELERREHKYQEYLVRKAKEQARGNVVLTVRKLAELGNVDAMYFLAVGSYNDQYLTNNSFESIELCEKAATAGSVEAMVYMGLCCVTHFNGCKGNGVDAINWFSKAASNGSAEALRFLAICRYNGIGGDNLGPSSNRYWALDLLSEAIRQGDEEAKRIEKAVMKSQIINISKSEIWDRRNASIDKFKIGKIV